MIEGLLDSQNVLHLEVPHLATPLIAINMGHGEVDTIGASPLGVGSVRFALLGPLGNRIR